MQGAGSRGVSCGTKAVLFLEIKQDQIWPNASTWSTHQRCDPCSSSIVFVRQSFISLNDYVISRFMWSFMCKYLRIAANYVMGR